MRHKWKSLRGSPVKGEIDRKACTKCGVEVRRIRHGSTKPRGGWIEVQFRLGMDRWVTDRGGRHGVPICSATIKCPTCQGSGLIPKTYDRAGEP